MAITIVKSDGGTAAFDLGQALRAAAINAGNGALFINDQSDGEVAHLLEKIIIAMPFVPGTPIDEIPWKPNPHIIVVQSKVGRLKDIEDAVPGFSEKFGPVATVQL